MNFSSITDPWWDDKPVAIVGGGHSLQGFDLNKLRDFHILATKGTIFDLPWADAGFGLDRPRYEEWEAKLAQVGFPVYWAMPEDQGERLGPTKPGNVLFIKRTIIVDALSSDPSQVSGGGTSGFGALGITVTRELNMAT